MTIMYQTITTYLIGAEGQPTLFTTTDADAADWLVKYAKFDRRMPTLTATRQEMPVYDR